MSSRNAYLSKLLYVQSLNGFSFPFFNIKCFMFTPEKGRSHYGSVKNRSHVIVDFRPVFKDYDNLLKIVIRYVNTGIISELHDVFMKHKFIKIESLTIQQIKEIHDANTVLFANLVADVHQQQLIDEINKI